MKLIDDWRAKLNKMWSVRVAVFTALLASADSILSAFVGSIPPLVYAVLSIVIVAVRVMHQAPNDP